MGRHRTIQYAIDRSTNLVVSRVDREYAWPILDYDGMKPENNFKTQYNLEKIPVGHLSGDEYDNLEWTRKIPTRIKNYHRKFWGMKPLKLGNEFVTVKRVCGYRVCRYVDFPKEVFVRIPRQTCCGHYHMPFTKMERAVRWCKKNRRYR